MKVAKPRTPPRVLHVGKYYPPYMGGIETHLETLSQGIQPAVDLHVVVANTDRETVVDEVDGVEVTRLGTWFNLSGAPISPGLVGAIRRLDPDIVHMHLPHPAAALAYLASGHRGKLVVSYHSDIIRQRMLGRAFEPILHRLLRRADAIVVATERHIDTSPILVDYRDRCRLIPYGISLERFTALDDHKVDEIRARYGPNVVLTVGRQIYYKGFEHLIAAMQHVDGHLLLIGEGPLASQLKALTQELGVTGKVTFVGRCDDIVPYYVAADVFVLPSVARSEAFGIVQIEAMACGTPVVNTNLDSGVPWVSRHGETGLTVEPGNVGELGDAIRTLLADPARRQELGAAARARAWAEFRDRVMIRRTLDLYAELVGTPIPTPVTLDQRPLLC